MGNFLSCCIVNFVNITMVFLFLLSFLLVFSFNFLFSTSNSIEMNTVDSNRSVPIFSVVLLGTTDFEARFSFLELPVKIF